MVDPASRRLETSASQCASASKLLCTLLLFPYAVLRITCIFLDRLILVRLICNFLSGIRGQENTAKSSLWISRTMLLRSLVLLGESSSGYK